MKFVFIAQSKESSTLLEKAKVTSQVEASYLK